MTDIASRTPPSTLPSLRTLPFRVRPLPDEPFDSWLETMAYRYRSPLRDMAAALGLTNDTPGDTLTHWRANSWATHLDEHQLARLVISTRIPETEFQAMTRMHYAAAVIRYTRAGRISNTCPATGVAGRYCPECLADSAGRWRMSWQFPFGFACLRHHRILVDDCPSCGQRPRQMGHPLALIPAPGSCYNRYRTPGTAHPPRCGGDLTLDSDRVPATREVLNAQRLMLRLVSTGRGSFGIYSDHPQPAIRVLEDIALLARAARIEATTLATREHEALGEALTDRFHLADPDNASTRTYRARRAAPIAVGNAIAYRALASAETVTALLRGRVSHSTSYAQHTPQLRELIRTALGRRSRPSTILRETPAVSGASPERRAAKLPALLWPHWCAMLAPHRMDPQIAATALSAMIVLTGSHLSYAAAALLLDPHTPGRQVAHVMRELGRSEAEHDTLRALSDLAHYLDTHDTPIDYARRRALDYAHLLPETLWKHICQAAGVHPGTGRRWRAARLNLYIALSGNRADRAPHEIAPRPGEDTPTLMHLLDGASEPVRTALEQAGEQFLRDHGITEPVSWSPPLSVLTEPITPIAPPELSRTWAAVRPAANRLIAHLPTPDVIAAYQAGRCLQDIGAAAGVGKQAVGRLLQAVGEQLRPPGRPTTIHIDERWLRERYQTGEYTIAELAAECDCSSSTISRHLHAARIPILRHPRRHPSPDSSTIDP